MTYSVAVIGTGEDPENSSREGFAMAYRHADAYEELDDCELVACADIVPENAAAFADAYGVPDDHVFEDYEAMLDAVDVDVVSVCVPPAVHADIVVGCAKGGVDAIHCEKPMAHTWGGAQRMAQVCWRRDVQLTFNHQRRFGTPFRQAKALLDDGDIGDLERVEFEASNIYDYGSHSFDLANYFNDEGAVAWVIAGLDYREENVFFGAHNENQALVQWEYDNGVSGLAATGRRTSLVGAHHRLVGTDGEIEVGGGGETALRIRRAGDAEWEELDCDGEDVHGPGFIQRAVADVVDAVGTDREPELSARHALTATETIFAAWESARRRGRVDLPLEVEGNALEEMVESGALTPEPRE
ncbi:MAG: Gfo/Idh/MocA family protein [Halobacteriaceae archaeon]